MSGTCFWGNCRFFWLCLFSSLFLFFFVFFFFFLFLFFLFFFLSSQPEGAGFHSAGHQALPQGVAAIFSFCVSGICVWEGLVG